VTGGTQAGRDAVANVALNNGDGTFAASTSVAMGVKNFADVMLGDIDGDGSLDILLTDQGRGVMAALSNGDGTFGSPKLLSSGGGSAYFGLALGDVDHQHALHGLPDFFS